MILQIDQPKEGIKIGVDQSLEMGIDLSSPEKIFYILSQGFYKNPKKAIIQELTSNMFDAYIEADKNIMDDPAYIILTKDTIEFRDKGIGISPDRMEKIMSKFFASTKDKNENTIGAFGLNS